MANVLQRFQFGGAELDAEALLGGHDQQHMGLAVPAIDVVGGGFGREDDIVIVEHVMEDLGQRLENFLFVHACTWM